MPNQTPHICIPSQGFQGTSISLGQQLRASLVHLWEMDAAVQGPSRILDSKGSLALRVFGTGVFTPGKVQNCVIFDGTTTNLQGGPFDVSTFAQAFTVTIWVKPTGIPAALGNIGTLFNNGNSIRLYVDGTGNQASFGATYTNGLNARTIFDNDFPLAFNTWNFLSFSRSLGGFITFQINAGFTDVILPWTAIDSFTGNVNVGSEEDGGTYFPGNIDDVAMFSSQLSRSQLLYLYNSGAARRYPWDGAGGNFILNDGTSGKLISQTSGNLIQN